VTEVYKLRCFVCHCEVQIPTTARSCVRCGTTFEIDWSAERQAYESKGDRQVEKVEREAS
jgi:hypothetical protein